MSNMSYCRFENTLADLQDCADNLRNKLSSSEAKARQRLVLLCGTILEELGASVDIPSVLDFSAESSDEE